jgi:hypothetical protein
MGTLVIRAKGKTLIDLAPVFSAVKKVVEEVGGETTSTRDDASTLIIISVRGKRASAALKKRLNEENIQYFDASGHLIE